MKLAWICLIYWFSNSRILSWFPLWCLKIHSSLGSLRLDWYTLYICISFSDFEVSPLWILWSIRPLLFWMATWQVKPGPNFLRSTEFKLLLKIENYGFADSAFGSPWFLNAYSIVPKLDFCAGFIWLGIYLLWSSMGLSGFYPWLFCVSFFLFPKRACMFLSLNLNFWNIAVNY